MFDDFYDTQTIFDKEVPKFLVVVKVEKGVSAGGMIVLCWIPDLVQNNMLRFIRFIIIVSFLPFFLVRDLFYIH